MPRSSLAGALWSTTGGMRCLVAIWCCLVSLACVSHSAPPAVGMGRPAAQRAAAPSAHKRQSASEHVHATEDAAALEAVRAVHGGAGPWVVAGYRMGRYALARLGIERGSFDVEVVHYSPREVQYSCIADGAAAATGASLGRLSLTLEPAAAAQTRTTYRNKRTGEAVTLATTDAFAARYAALPRAQLSAAGAEVLRLPDAEIFTEAAP